MTLFIITRFAELALFIFPVLHPTIQPEVPNAVSTTIKGIIVENMPSHFLNALGLYYFPGMYSVILLLVTALMSLKKNVDY